MTGPQITKGTQIIKEVTVSVFTWHDITYQCLKSSMKKLLALINDFSKAARYKNWVHYYKQWTLKRKFKQFYIYNSIKTNTTPQRWEIYTLKTITLMKEIKEDTINGKIFCAQPWPVGPVGALSHKVAGSQWGHIPMLGVQSLVRRVQKATDWCFPLSFSPFL